MDLKCKKNKKKQHIVKIFYMGILCITLTERNTKRFVQHWHSPASPSTERSWFFFNKICNFFFICYAAGLLQYSKSVWSKVGTPTVYIFINCKCIKIVSAVEKVAKCTPYLQCFHFQVYILTFFVADIYMNIAKIRNLQIKLRFIYVGSV
jgi:hypothetical protein